MWVSTERTGAIGGRYEIGRAIGHGGMGQVYLVSDAATGRKLALKQLSCSPDSRHRSDIEELFEREYHTLAELAHPSIIEVYDYGRDHFGPYYTMELLDGADLREQAPLEYRQACALAYDVCSSLALIHSRRFVHRDVSPRNVRCTADGRAKLIDFGAMVPMGRGAAVVGTASYLAPEVLYRTSLDGRTDLFSLGATLYFALTGRLAYAARDFERLPEQWKARPLRPSAIVAGIPEALDALVLSLLSTEPAARPRSAFEVMQRLAPIASLDRSEPLGVSQSYLSTPVMVGRDEQLSVIKAEMDVAFLGRSRTVLVESDAGLGRSRLLDACALAAKTLGAVVIRVNANAVQSANLVAGQVLAEQIMDALLDKAVESAKNRRVVPILFQNDEISTPDASAIGPKAKPTLRNFSSPETPRFETQRALVEWILDLSLATPIAIAADDFHKLDEASAALLASLASRAARHRLFFVATIAREPSAATETAVGVLRERAATVAIEPLTPQQTDDLFASLFGDVPNVGSVSREVHALSNGNPRSCMDLAQHLVDTKKIFYAGGAWTLPDRLNPRDFPASAEDALRSRVRALSPLERELVEAQALASHESMTREQYRRLSGADPNQIDRAITGLLAQQTLVSDGNVYTIAHSGWVRALSEQLSDEDRAKRHAALSTLYGDEQPLALVRHLLAAGLHERGLERLLSLLVDTPDFDFYSAWTINPAEMAPIFEQALEVARELGRSAREQHLIRRWLVALSVVSDDKYFANNAPDWLARLELDSGLSDWRELSDVENEGERLSRAMQKAFERYGATPESDRVYRPDEAIRGLALYVAVGIAIGARSQNGQLIDSLGPLLAPFTGVSRVLAAVRLNAIATAEVVCLGKLERARARWLESYEMLKTVSPSEFERIDLMRRAVAYGIGAVESRLGLASTSAWADLLDEDPLQKVNAAYLRKIFALHRGDRESAERYRRHAEILQLGSPRQMFTSSPVFELPAHCLAGDLTGVKEIFDRLEPLAERYPGYRAYRCLAEGFFWKISGNWDRALEAFERAIVLSEPIAEEPWRVSPGWPRAVAGAAEIHVAEGRFETARKLTQTALDKCNRLGIGVLSHEITRSLALAEAKLGDVDAATRRLDAIIEEEVTLGVSGLNLGASYEARTRVAIWANDKERIEEFARLTAREYRHGTGSALGARYERLVDEAGAAISGALPDLADFESSDLDSTRVDGRASASTLVAEALRGARDKGERVARALSLFCDASEAGAGHLYLFDEEGIALAASCRTTAPPDRLSEFVNEYVNRTLEGNTSVAPGMDGGTLYESAVLDVEGVFFRPVLLTDLRGGALNVAGVAVLVDRRLRKQKIGEGLLAAAIGAALARRGDASYRVLEADS